MSNGPISQITYAFAKDKGMVPMGDDTPLQVGVRPNADLQGLVELRRALGVPISPVLLDADAFEQVLAARFSRSDFQDQEAEAALASQGGLESLVDGIPQTADLLDGDDDAPIIRLINGLIYEAVKRGASDIHIDPFEDKLSIRYRIDGVLQEVLTPSRKIASPLVSRVKVMARLDIAEKRMPQDGRISLSIAGRSVDVRVATLPTRYGERIALRLLDNRTALMGLEQLGMDSDTLDRLTSVLKEPNGVVLVCGPTGSGKTTTLYAAMAMLNTGEVNLMTLEDPIEYGLDGVSQTAMDHKVGLTFAATLRSILRNDPNVVMIGEIRDTETANVAMEFALTGRLALSTIHTNSSAGAVTRLRDMGVETFLLASTLRAVLAQRLVRRLCETCKTAYEPDVAERKLMGVSETESVTFYKSNGCMACSNTGYRGRAGIYELLVVDDDVKSLIHSNASEKEIENVAFADHNMLFGSGRNRVLNGQTTIEEVLRVCRSEVRANGGV